MMDGSFITALGNELRRPQTVLIDGVALLSVPTDTGGWHLEDLDDKIPDPSPKPLVVRTLGGFADYVSANIDNVSFADSIVHVVEPCLVELCSKIEGRFCRRKTYIRAEKPDCRFAFGQFLDAETFNVSMQALFTAAGDRDRVLQIVGTIKEESVRTSADDGTSQVVTARAGLVAVQEVKVPNPVSLAPYRTFPEVAQPASPFILRMRSGKDGAMPSCALFEADGGAWKIAAIRSVAEHLKPLLPKELSLIA